MCASTLASLLRNCVATSPFKFAFWIFYNKKRHLRVSFFWWKLWTTICFAYRLAFYANEPVTSHCWRLAYVCKHTRLAITAHSAYQSRLIGLNVFMFWRISFWVKNPDFNTFRQTKYIGWYFLGIFRGKS